MNDQVLIRYLLGLLGPDETERLDEATFVDDEIAARLRLVEDQLVDDYVRGALTGETLARFESHYLSSPRRRERVMFARGFVPIVDRAGALSAAAAPPRSTFPVRLRPLIPAVAAALLLLASGVLVFQAARQKQETTVAQREPAAPDRQAREPEQQAAGSRSAGAARGGEARPGPQPAGTVQDAPAIALLLLPQTRSAGSIPALSIPAGAGTVAVELRLESIEFARYQVGLRDPAVNAVIWRSGWIAATSSGGEPSLRIALPTGVLKPQHYSFDLIGQRPDDGSEVVGSYALEILPR